VAASRYLFLIAGILGVLALFQPMISIGRGPVKVELSAYELSFGLGKTRTALDYKIPSLAKRHIPPDILQTRDDIKLVSDATRGAALAYIPAGLLLLIGAFGVWRKKATPRALGAVALLLGAISIAAWFGIRYGVAYGIEEEPALARLRLQPVFGAHVLLVAGALAVVGALKSLLRRDAD
jgi:hypothetical protein